MKRLISLLLSALMVVTLGTINVFGDGNVAKIGDTEYPTLADAIIKGVPTDGTKTTITMIANEVLTEEITIDEGKKIVLDLNGKTISNCEIGFNFTTTKSSKGSIPARFTIIVEGELEIKDNGSNGKINIQSYSYGTTKALLVKNNGKVVVTSGYIYGEYAAFYVVGNTNLPPQEEIKIPTLIINNGTIKGDRLGIGIKGKTATLEINGGEVIGTTDYAVSTNGTQDWYDGGNCKITINGGNLTSTEGFGIYNPAESIVTIQGGTVTGTTAVSVKGGSVTVKDDAVLIATGAKGEPGPAESGSSETGDALYVEDSYINHKPIVNVKGGKFSSANGEVLQYWTNKADGADDKGYLLTNAGYYNKPVDSTYIDYGYECINTPESDSNHDVYPYMIGKKEVAKIGDVIYPSLADAIAAVPTDGTKTTIKMLENVDYSAFNDKDGASTAIVIPSAKNIVLDLNGKTISGTSDAKASAYLIHNKGYLTIVDSNTSGKITYKSNGPDSSYGYGTSTILNRGALTIENGVVENTTIGGASYAVDNQTLWYDDIIPVTFDMNGGKVECTTGDAAIRQSAGLGTIYTKKGEIVKNYVTISGGTVSGDIWIQNSNNSYTDLKVIDGVITGKIYDTAANSISNLTWLISGGEIGDVNSRNGKDKFITGGWFTKPVNSNYAYDGYLPSDSLVGKGAPNSINVYTVIKNVPKEDLENKETNTVKEDGKDVDTTFGTKVTIDETLPETDKAKISSIQVSNLNKAISTTEKNNTIAGAAVEAAKDTATPTVEVEVVMNVELAKANKIVSLVEKIEEDKAGEYTPNDVEYIDITVDKIVKANGKVIEIEDVKTTDAYQIISFPVDKVLGQSADKEKVFVYRNHIDAVGNETNTAFKKVTKDYGPLYNGECYWIDGYKVYIKAKNFSIYGFGVQNSVIPAEEKPIPAPTPSHDDSSIGGYKIPKTGIR